MEILFKPVIPTHRHGAILVEEMVGRVLEIEYRQHVTHAHLLSLCLVKSSRALLQGMWQRKQMYLELLNWMLLDCKITKCHTIPGNQSLLVNVNGLF